MLSAKIEFSREFAIAENRVGFPERPVQGRGEFAQTLTISFKYPYLILYHLLVSEYFRSLLMFDHISHSMEQTEARDTRNNG